MTYLIFGILNLFFNFLVIQMAWHSKWHNIKHRKAAQDAKKAKIYSKLAKQIQLEAMKWADPDLNPSLALAISKAKSAWVPKPVIEKAVKKWSWQDTWETLQEVFYEWYWPEGVAMYIKCITSNTNRSAASIRSIFTKYGWNMWQAWSVAWQFSAKWVTVVNWKVKEEIEKWKKIKKIIPLNDDELEEELLELPVEDYEKLDDNSYRIVSSRKDLMQVVSSLENKWYNVESYDIEYIPKNTVKLSEEGEKKLEKLINTFEDDDDVDEVFHNAE